ncbi:MAG: DUF2325 domain-containing protein [Rhodocyclaceae bacterium]|nr:DUF2325 domain-containing protein [Rhodocyclaceae bacterium]
MSANPFKLAATASSIFTPVTISDDSDKTTPVTSSRRRRLWEIPHKFHCPVIGVCFDVDQLRGLLAKCLHFPRETTDYVLHTSAVGACEERCKTAEILHKNLDQRFQLSIKKIATVRTPAALADYWRQASRSGSDIPAALWVCWTHPACDANLEQEIFADIHMIQHQVGTGTRADLSLLKDLQADNASLQLQLDAAKREVEAMRNEKSRETRLLGERVAELRVDLAGKEAMVANLSGQLDHLREHLPDLKDRQSLARRASDAEARAAALTAHASALEDEIKRYRGMLEITDKRMQALLAIHENFSDPMPNAVNLDGKSVLCVGGRSGSVDGYRQIIEQRGGRFLHHDGGLEESLHRVEAVVASADLVICQAGCISHNAYWRVKEQCKRTGKQCVFVKSAGVSSFERVVSETLAEGVD